MGLNCPCIAKDVEKIVDTYWDLGAANAKSSPPPFNACGRESDIDAMVKVIDDAAEFVHMAVMDYIPATLYEKTNFYYGVLDDAIRRAAFRGVKVKFMMSKWQDTRSALFAYLHSLAELNGALPCKYEAGSAACTADSAGEIQIRIFQVPPDGPITDAFFARVQHNKYFVTDTTAYFGTSNWSADYWLTTAGIGVVVRSENAQALAPLVKATQDVFMRDWDSPYATDIAHFDKHGNQLNATLATLLQ